MLTGTLITAAGFLPIGLAKSAAGEYTFSMFSVNALALIISWFVAVLFTPSLAGARVDEHLLSCPDVGHVDVPRHLPPMLTPADGWETAMPSSK